MQVKYSKNKTREFIYLDDLKKIINTIDRIININ